MDEDDDFWTDEEESLHPAIDLYCPACDPEHNMPCVHCLEQWRDIAYVDQE